MEGERKKGGGRSGRWWEEKREPSILRTSTFKEMLDKKFGEKANKNRGNSATTKKGRGKREVRAVGGWWEKTEPSILSRIQLVLGQKIYFKTPLKGESRKNLVKELTL